MKNSPIKLHDNSHLYSGDNITINNNDPLLVEIIDDQTIKLRSVKDNNYLSQNNNDSIKKLFSLGKKLDFSTDFKDALTFTIKDDNGKVSLQTDNNKYLKSDNKNFSLSSKERSLTITKQQNTEKIFNYHEEIVKIDFHEKDKKETKTEESLVVRETFADNKGPNPLPISWKLTRSKQSEYSFTSSNDFTWGVSVDLNFNCPLTTGMKIGGQFQAKHGTSNSIKKTDTENFEESFNPTCSPWKKMQVKSVTKRTEFSIPYTASIKRIIDGRPYEYSINGNYCSNHSDSHYLTEEITVRNILLVGWTGSGKTTLAKVLSKSDDFVESNKSIPSTKFHKKSEEFEHKGNYYCVIDNIGFGDTKLTQKEVLMRVGEAINDSYQGLSHVLFVFAGRFSDQEKEGFNNLAALKITNSYITMVRSRFENFGNEEECEKDKASLVKQSPEISKLFDNCRGLLHVDNDDKYSREDSRIKILNHLHSSCTNNPFKPKEWDDITNLIEGYFKKKERLENEVKENIDQKAEIEQQIVDLENDTAEKVKAKSQAEEISEFFELAQVEIKTK